MNIVVWPCYRGTFERWDFDMITSLVISKKSQSRVVIIQGLRAHTLELQLGLGLRLTVLISASGTKLNSVSSPFVITRCCPVTSNKQPDSTFSIWGRRGAPDRGSVSPQTLEHVMAERLTLPVRWWEMRNQLLGVVSPGRKYLSACQSVGGGKGRRERGKKKTVGHATELTRRIKLSGSFPPQRFNMAVRTVKYIGHNTVTPWASIIFII